MEFDLPPPLPTIKVSGKETRCQFLERMALEAYHRKDYKKAIGYGNARRSYGDCKLVVDIIFASQKAVEDMGGTISILTEL